eukprot:6204915-Pleurochrysis_carterae.AAC.3
MNERTKITLKLIAVVTSPEGLFTANAPLPLVGVEVKLEFSIRLGASETLTKSNQKMSVPSARGRPLILFSIVNLVVHVMEVDIPLVDS